ncbi:MAG TPA: ABC transporter permease [Candidatus Dormibacteraeota bacterium]|nr:ABC transporter permease [Candidatus Dormibacteraeota bacterium]
MFFGTYGTLIVLVGMVVVFWVASPSAFGTLENFRNILADMAPGAVIAAGLTMVLVAGDFDLSVGYQASFAGVLVVGLLARQHYPIPVAILTVLGLGVVFGIVNGLIVTKLGVNAFIATLGTGTLIIGLNYAYSGGVPIQLSSGRGLTRIGLGSLAGVPYPILIMVGVLLVLWVLLNLTTLGQHMKATGNNIDVARRLGVRVDGARITAFVLAGVCATGTGIMLSAILGNGDTTAGDVYLLQSYAAAFLGSAALRDGEFHILGTAVGILTVAVGYNGLAILGAPTFAQYAFAGGLLVVAVALSTLSRRYARD